MATYWLAIDWNERYASFDELRHRRVVAQGWPNVPSLESLLMFVKHGERQAFMDAVAVLERLGHQQTTYANRVFWDLLSMKAGDVVVGIEGTEVKGLCQLQQHGYDSYRYDSPEAYDYAHTIGFPVEWVAWDAAVIGPPPRTPGRTRGAQPQYRKRARFGRLEPPSGAANPASRSMNSRVSGRHRAVAAGV